MEINRKRRTHETRYTGFVSEYINQDYEDSVRKNLVNKLLEMCFVIGLTRWINEDDEKLSLDFKKLDYSKFIDIDGFNLKFDKKKYIDELLSNNSDVNLSKEDLDFKITYYEERGKDKCKFQVCNGHDMTEVIRLLLEQKDLLNSPIHGNISKGRIGSYLRMGFTLEEFKKTELYDNLITWQKNHRKQLFKK